MTDVADNYQNARLQWQQEREKRLQVVKKAAVAAAKSLKVRGVTQIELEYEGIGDDGCITNCHWEGLDTISRQELQPLEELVFQILPLGWEINQGSRGSVFFDLETGEVSLEHKWSEISEEERLSWLEMTGVEPLTNAEAERSSLRLELDG